MNKDRETANKYRQQALQGDLMAMNNMGVCYAQGIGVVENHATAFEWYMKAAEKGDTYACYNVAECYYLGDGVEQDYEKAFHWYIIAAEKGDVPIILGRGPRKTMPRRMSGGSKQPSEDTCRVRRMWVPIIGMAMAWKRMTVGLLFGMRWQVSKVMRKHNSPLVGSI